MLIALSIFKIRAFLEGRLRLRTACDLMIDPSRELRLSPEDFELPSLDNATAAMPDHIGACAAELGEVTRISFAK